MRFSIAHYLGARANARLAPITHLARLAALAIFGLLAGALGAGCANRDTPDAQAMAHYETFAVVAAANLENSAQETQPAISDAVERTIRAVLERKGYCFVGNLGVTAGTATAGTTATRNRNRPDFEVRYSISVPNENRRQMTPASSASAPAASTVAGNSDATAVLGPDFAAGNSSESSVSITFINAEGHVFWKPPAGLTGTSQSLSVAIAEEIVRTTLTPLPLKR